MKILVLGAGKMGAWLVESLCLDHEVGIYDPDPKKMRYLFNSRRFTTLEDIEDFVPDMLINAVSLQHTISAFELVIPHIPDYCILSDITSVKGELQVYYKKKGLRFVSTHPMFGPTFANIRELAKENAIIIQESDEEGKQFFREFYKSFHINIFEYTFKEHDETIAYSLSIPFSSSLVFASCMKKQEAPGTTFRKHLAIADGLLSEDNNLLSEILFNEFTLPQVEKIADKLEYLIEILKKKDKGKLHLFLDELRGNIK